LTVHIGKFFHKSDKHNNTQLLYNAVLDMIGKQNYQEPGVEAELNFEFFEFTIISSK